MKKIICVLLAIAMLSGCSTRNSSTTEKKLFANPGTYTSSKAGRNGDIVVTVVFTSEVIESIEFESEETETIGVPAMENIKEEILNKQTLAVDSVTGATISVDAFLEAIKDCAKQAGADEEALTKAVEKTSTKQEYVTDADIIVVGGGAAGMTAAITAADNGASVILLEKSNNLGGNTVCSANGINAADSDVQKASEEYIAANADKEGLKQLQKNNPDAQDNLIDAFVENSGETINWLSDLGVEFNVDIQNDQRNSTSNPYMLKAMADGSTALTMINTVVKKINETNVIVYTNMDAYELVTDENGTVIGVKARDGEGEDITLTGRSVLLATGGFGQNSELVAEVNPHLAGAVTDEICPTTGEGLMMAKALGAATANLDAIQTFPAVIPGYGMILPMMLPGGFVPDALYVNNDAKRFTAEGFEIPDAILAQDKGEVFCVFDESGMNDGLKNLVNSGVIYSANTAEELAEKLGLDANALNATIEAFNEDIADGKDDAFGREQNLNPIEGTLYGYRFGVGAHYFMGGILINENTQVVREDGSIIDGLYAAGEVTGGFHGTFRVDGSGLGDSFTFGRIAGRVMSEIIK